MLVFWYIKKQNKINKKYRNKLNDNSIEAHYLLSCNIQETLQMNINEQKYMK